MLSLKSLSRSANLALIVITSFLFYSTFATSLTGCGGGSSNGGTGGATFGEATTATTDSDGKATFTANKLSGVDQVEVNLVGPNKQAAAGINVNFNEADDGYMMLVVSDPTRTYGTTIITADIDDYTSASAMVLETGEKTPVQMKLIDGGISIFGLIAIAGVLLVGAISAISLECKIKKVRGELDPAHFLKTGTGCFSVNALKDRIDVTKEGAELVFWTGASLVAAGAVATKAALYEFIVSNITPDIQDEVVDKFWDEIVSAALDGSSVGKDTNICWVLHNPLSLSDDYNGVFEMRPDIPCNSDAECENLTALSGDVDNVDQDLDGYSLAQDDCNDLNPTIHPGAPEICGNGVDDDCSGGDKTCDLTINATMKDYFTDQPITDGSSGDSQLIKVEGTISGGAVSEATMVVNSSPQTIQVTGGSFSSVASMTGGGFNNLIEIAANDGTNFGQATLNYTYTGTSEALTIVLTWDSCQDLDLYVVEPNGTMVYYANKTGTDGSLDVDDTNGWGPETYNAPNTSSGTYTYYVDFYGCGACSTPCDAANYQMRVYTPTGNTFRSGTLTNVKDQSPHHQITFD